MITMNTHHICFGELFSVQQCHLFIFYFFGCATDSWSFLG